MVLDLRPWLLLKSQCRKPRVLLYFATRNQSSTLKLLRLSSSGSIILSLNIRYGDSTSWCTICDSCFCSTANFADCAPLCCGSMSEMVHLIHLIDSPSSVHRLRTSTKPPLLNPNLVSSQEARKLYLQLLLLFKS